MFNGDASLRFDDIWGVVRGEGIVIIKAEGVYKILRASPFVRGESIGFGFGSHEAQGGGRFLVSNDDCQVYNTCDIPNNAFFNDGSLRVMVVRPIVGRKGISRRGSHLEVGSVSKISFILSWRQSCRDEPGVRRAVRMLQWSRMLDDNILVRRCQILSFLHFFRSATLSRRT